MYTIEETRIEMMNTEADYSEDDLYNMSKEEFCETYKIPEEEWDMLQKEIQEM